MTRLKVLGEILIFVMTFSPLVWSDVPTTIHVQGRLTDAAGVPMEGIFKFTFKIFNAVQAERKSGPTKPGPS